MKVLSYVNFGLMVASAVAYFGYNHELFSYPALVLFAVVDTFPSKQFGEWLAK